MKTRVTFITNSSSSSYVAVGAKLDTGTPVEETSWYKDLRTDFLDDVKYECYDGVTVEAAEKMTLTEIIKVSHGNEIEYDEETQMIRYFSIEYGDNEEITNIMAEFGVKVYALDC